MSDVKGREKLIVRGRSNHSAWLLCASFIHLHSRALDPLASFKAGSWLAMICTDLSIDRYELRHCHLLLPYLNDSRTAPAGEQGLPLDQNCLQEGRSRFYSACTR